MVVGGRRVWDWWRGGIGLEVECRSVGEYGIGGGVGLEVEEWKEKAKGKEYQTFHLPAL